MNRSKPISLSATEPNIDKGTLLARLSDLPDHGGKDLHTMGLPPLVRFVFPGNARGVAGSKPGFLR